MMQKQDSLFSRAVPPELTTHEAKTLANVLAHLAPADDSRGLGTEPRAPAALTALVQTLPGVYVVVADGVRLLDSAAAALGSPRFVDLSGAAQENVLQSMGARGGGTVTLTVLGTSFIGLLRRTAIVAWLADPSVASSVGAGRSALEGGNPHFTEPPAGIEQDRQT